MRKAGPSSEQGLCRAFLALLIFYASLAHAQQEPQDIRFGVLGLFHPREL
jgi:hypothetical protein